MSRNSMEQSPSYEADSRSDNQEISYLGTRRVFTAFTRDGYWTLFL
jgi:hypothetical protein